MSDCHVLQYISIFSVTKQTKSNRNASAIYCKHTIAI